MTTIQFTDRIQTTLSHAQAIPVIGLCVSPVKGLLAAIEAIVGLASTILFGTFALVTDHTQLWNLAGTSVLHLGNGTLHFGFACGNLLSLGLLSHQLRNSQTA